MRASVLWAEEEAWGLDVWAMSSVPVGSSLNLEAKRI